MYKTLVLLSLIMTFSVFAKMEELPLSNSSRPVCYLKFTDTFKIELVRLTDSTLQVLFNGHKNDLILNIVSAVESGVCTFEAKECKFADKTEMMMDGYSGIEMNVSHPRTKDGFIDVGLVDTDNLAALESKLKSIEICK